MVCHAAVRKRSDPGTANWDRTGRAGVSPAAGAQTRGVFTPDLSVPEHVLLAKGGVEPLGLAGGSSAHHIR